MNKNEPLEQLASFYQSLDSIPTPPLDIRPKSRWGLWSLAFAPFGAVAIAYAFISLCASAQTEAGVPSSIQLPIDRYALDEIRATTPSKHSGSHASNELSLRSLI